MVIMIHDGVCRFSYVQMNLIELALFVCARKRKSKRTKGFNEPFDILSFG